MENKAIITNFTLLRGKYGTEGLASILSAVDSWVAEDALRGLASKLFDISDPAVMGPLSGTAVTTTGPRATKEAVDAVCAAENPAYVVLLGGPDIVPHQSLANPVTGPVNDDPDDDVPSDLPYACTAPYCRDIASFVGPTRVVGRLPDLTGAAVPEYLIELIGKAAAWRKRPRLEYSDYFGLSTESWRDSSRESARKVFGTSTQMELSPPGNDNWSASTLQRRSHFINCHGDIEDPRFYGEDAGRSSMPISLSSGSYAGTVTEGAVVAAECCYGTELYDPHSGELTSNMAICNRFLAEGGCAFVGSTNVAYGPAIGNGAADFICQFFFNAVLAGASTGRAMLQARHEFVFRSAPLGPIDFKTLGQFILLRDPSIHPVEVEPSVAGVAPKAVAPGDMAGIAQRRTQLVKRGSNLAKTTAVPVGAVREPSQALIKRLLSEAEAKGLSVEKATSIPLLLEGGRGDRKNALLRSKSAVCHVLSAKRPEPEAKVSREVGEGRKPRRSKRREALLDYLARGAVIVAKEVDGEIRSVQTLLPH